MRWRKLGLIYAPQGNKWWARQYAILPTAEIVNETTIRVYFASLDEHKYGRIGYIEVDADDPRRILYETEEPVLDVGELGTFDDSGVNPSSIVTVDGDKYLYYIGWQRAERVPYLLFGGLAVQKTDSSKFKKVTHVPILDRTASEPFLRSAPSVLFDDGKWKVWYVSADGWTKVGEVLYPTYGIAYAESEDGYQWFTQATRSVDLAGTDEFGLGRPWVIKESDRYRMWYSIRSRGEPYRIGYAESKDGITWERLDHLAGIERSIAGWDSEMICYACVIDVNNRRYMFYNGNRHGATGFGCAIMDSE